jgi:hypothetical protein
MIEELHLARFGGRPGAFDKKSATTLVIFTNSRNLVIRKTRVD